MTKDKTTKFINKKLNNLSENIQEMTNEEFEKALLDMVQEIKKERIVMNWENEADRIDDDNAIFLEWRDNNLDKLIEEYTEDEKERGLLRKTYHETYFENEDFESFVIGYWNEQNE